MNDLLRSVGIGVVQFATGFLMIFLGALSCHADTVVASGNNLEGKADSELHPFSFEFPAGNFGLRLHQTIPSGSGRCGIYFARTEEPVSSGRVEQIDENTFEIYEMLPGNYEGVIYGETDYRGFSYQLTVFPVPSAETLVTDIPRIMAVNGWVKGATLMQRWFDSKGGTDRKTVTMNWVLSYPRVKSIYDDIFEDEIYMNRKAREQMSKDLRKARVGPFETYCNQRKSGLDWLAVINFDDLDTALNNFTLQVRASGVISMRGKKKVATIKRVGVLVIDSYDFNDDPGEDQRLGYWNKHTNFGGANFLLGTEMRNSSFRTYRNTYKKGKDFKIESRVKWTALKKSVSFELK